MKVLLIHGLGRTPLSLFNLEWHLNQMGYMTEQFSFFAFTEAFDCIVQRLNARLQELACEGTYGVVAHSLGGLLTRAALSFRPVKNPKHIVMLGTPNQRPRLAPLAWKLKPFQWFSGQCGLNLASSDFFTWLPGLESPYTIVAGTGGPRGWWSPFGNELNDGIVALSETRLSYADSVVQLPVEHTFMMNDPRVHQIIVKAFASK